MSKKLTIKIIITAIIFIAVFISVKVLLNEQQVVFSKRAELLALKSDLKSLDNILSDLNTNKVKIERLSKSLPGSYEETAFAVNQTERLSLDKNQELTTQIDKEVVQDEVNTAVKVLQKTVGSYTDYSSFLTGISSLPYHTMALNLKIDKEGDRITTSYNYLLFIKDFTKK